MAMNKRKVKKISSFIFKWWLIAFIGLWLGNFLISKFNIYNKLLMLFGVTLIFSIVMQIVKSNDNPHSFYLREFIFYFLIYAFIIGGIGEALLPLMNSVDNIYYFIVLGLIISLSLFFVQKIKIRSKVLPWISLILFLLLLTFNLTYLQDMGLGKFVPYSGVQGDSQLPENKQYCPTPKIHPIYQIDSNGPKSLLNGLLDATIWREENPFSECYSGKYQNQNPNWIYCDNLIVSRWELSSLGNINYRWYAAVSAEWKPVKEGLSIFALEDFSCENGQKVTVEKGVTNYYVYDSRDGKQIKIKY